MIVVIAEKPSVARDIARVLGCTQRGEGVILSATYAVTWALGHLVTLCEPDEIDERYKKWRAADLPILPQAIPTKIIAKTRSQFQIIEKLLQSKDCESIICATDAGREGELIFRLIYEKCGAKQPVRRLWISSLTDAAIREGLSQMQSSAQYDTLYASARARAEADWLVGMNASRAFTLRYNALLSVGRVQTPTLAMLVRRAQEIRAFVPEEYYTVTAGFGDYSGVWVDLKVQEDTKRSRIATQEAAEDIVRAVRGQKAQVSQVAREAKKELSPYLYDLTSLQRDANRRFGFTAAKTLKVAQALYEEHKCITYPRTDSKHLPPDMIGRVEKTLSTLAASYQQAAAAIPRHEGKLPFSKRMFDAQKVTDHHAIIPTSQSVAANKLGADEQKLYDLIARRLIAAFYPAYEYESVTILTQVNEHVFRSGGIQVTQPGWKAVIADMDKKQEEPLPPLKVGDQRQVKSAKAKKEATKPPSPHTDASLLGAMEHAGREIEDEALREQMRAGGLGTPATRAAIIERLITVGYAQRRGKALEATEKGEALIQVVPQPIASAETTAKWETALEKIAHQQGDVLRFMDSIHRFCEYLVDNAAHHAPQAHFERPPRKEKAGTPARVKVKTLAQGVCPLCGSPVLETEKAFGCAAWKQGCPFTLWKNALSRFKGPLLAAADMAALLTQGQAQLTGGLAQIKEGYLVYTPHGAADIVKVPLRYERGQAAAQPADSKVSPPRKTKPAAGTKRTRSVKHKPHE